MGLCVKITATSESLLCSALKQLWQLVLVESREFPVGVRKLQ